MESSIPLESLTREVCCDLHTITCASVHGSSPSKNQRPYALQKMEAAKLALMRTGLDAFAGAQDGAELLAKHTGAQLARWGLGMLLQGGILVLSANIYVVTLQLVGNRREGRMH